MTEFVQAGPNTVEPDPIWMVGTAAPVMKKYIKHPATWVAKQKLRLALGKPLCYEIPKFDVGQDPRQGDLRETA